MDRGADVRPGGGRPDRRGRRARLGRLDLAFLGLLLAFGCWTLLSATWSPSTTSAVFEAQRILAYLGVVLLALLVVEKRTAPLLLGGCLAGVTLVAGYALLTRLLPGRLATFDTIAGYRLSDPIGYWNGLGIYAAMGVLLAVGFLARAERTAARAAAAALPVVLVTTLYFTFSRGSWIALAAGFAVAVAFDPARLRLLVAVARRCPVVCDRGVAGVALRRAHHPGCLARRGALAGSHAAAGACSAHPRLGRGRAGAGAGRPKGRSVGAAYAASSPASSSWWPWRASGWCGRETGISGLGRPVGLDAVP